LENAELQLLVEKLAVKCKNDAARQVTKLETERRVLRQQAVSLNLLEWLPKEAQELTLSLAEAEEREISPPSGRESSLKKSSSEEELYMRLWTLRETLLKLGFPDVKVEETLKHVLLYLPGTFTSSNRDVVPYLDESLDWLALHCLPAELPSYTQSSIQTRNESERLVSFISGKV
jgi:ATP-dependent RNA helicase DHX29